MYEPVAALFQPPTLLLLEPLYPKIPLYLSLVPRISICGIIPDLLLDFVWTSSFLECLIQLTQKSMLLMCTGIIVSGLECEMVGSYLSGPGCRSFSPTCGQKRIGVELFAAPKEQACETQLWRRRVYESVRVALRRRASWERSLKDCYYEIFHCWS